MSDPESKGGYTPTAADLAAYRRLEQRAAALAAGDEIPTYVDRLMGMPPFRDSPRADLRAIAQREVDRNVHDDNVVEALTHLAETPTRWASQKARAAITDTYLHEELRFSLDWNCAWLGDSDARARVVVEMHNAYTRCRIQAARRIMAARGFMRIIAANRSEERDYSPGDWRLHVEHGATEIETDDETMLVYRATEAAETKPPQTIEDVVAAELAELAGTPKPEPEEKADPGPKSLMKPKRGEGLVVVPRLPEGGTSWRREVAKSWTGKAGVELPLVKRGDVAGHARALKARWPHAATIIDTIVKDLATREAIRIRPTLLVGKPGSGKSSLAMAIAKQLGLPMDLVPLAGVADGSIMGTSAQYTSARVNTVLQVVNRSGIANPMMIWDEVEKASPSRHNGSPLDALLAMLEPDQARTYRDPALEVPCDLSMVSHLATANDLDQVPAPLRDRMRVLVMPEPTWQHLPVLVRAIVEDLAKERGLDPRWFEPLAEDEMHVVRRAWPGGSVRQLQRIVQVMVDGRDMIWGRA